MDVNFPSSGRFIVAVSGGVDSVVLLYLLKKQKNLDLTVAHFDHGIRTESSSDRKFVEELADFYGLPFVYGEGKLGPGASEEVARKARYEFLRQVQKEKEAEAIITAHHQDDLIETAVINILRGTNRKGLSSLQSRDDLRRPLLNIPKKDIKKYAKDNFLEWREDSTNEDTEYLRNYIRHRVVPRFGKSGRDDFLDIISNIDKTNKETDELLAEIMEQQAEDHPDEIDRAWFSQLPHAIAKEVMATWLREHNVRDFDQNNIERLVVAAKTAGSRRKFSVSKNVTLQIGKDSLALRGVER
jgi:tRNA(Ile)-lysidine synthase